MPSKTGVEKFSVSGTASVEFVTIFLLHGRKIIRCHSAGCMLRFGKARKVSTLDSSDSLCEHLELMKSYPGWVDDVLEDNDGAISDDECTFEPDRIPDVEVIITNNNSV